MTIDKFSKRRQLASVQEDPGWDDTKPAGPGLETGGDGAEDDNSIVSQIRRLIYGPSPAPSERWFDNPPAGVVDIATAGLSFIAAEPIAIGDSIALNGSGQALRASRVPSSNLYTVAGIALNPALVGGAVAVARIGSKVAARFTLAPASSFNGQPVWLDASGAASIAAAVSPPSADVILGILLDADGVNTTPQILFTPALQTLFF